MILELKDKAAKLGREADTAGAAALKTGDQIKDDALSALVNLGYRASTAKDAVDRIMKEAPAALSLDQLLKQVLRTLAG
jgi:holliday junction DNA helicase RuvA